MSNKKFAYDDLTELVRQIENIKKKSLLNEIRDIIFNSNPDLKYTENSNGIYFHFHNLNQETYSKLDKFLKKNKHLIIEEDSTENYFEVKNNKDKDETDFLTGFSNREKNLIKRRLYDTAISKNSELIPELDSSDKSENSEKNNSVDDVEKYIENNKKEKINPITRKSPKNSIFLKKNTIK